MYRPLFARIDTAALQHNLQRVRALTPASKVLAVLKADAYGHGVQTVASALQGADALGVLELEQALVLRAGGERRPIVLMEGYFSAEELPLLVEHQLVPVIHSMQQLAWLQEAWLPLRLDVWVKLNSGMNRLGFPPGSYREVVQQLSRWPQVGRVTLMSHFATADEEDGVAAQLVTFLMETEGMQLPVSLANSAAIIAHPDTHADWVRPGIMLYGARSGSASAASQGLRPVMSLLSRLIAVQHVEPGGSIGYGATVVAEYPMRIGVVACGYADGYPRHAPTGTPVLVGGRRCRLVGRVSMDMLTVDLSGCPDADVGTDVELWGAQLPVDEVAVAAGTLGYELLTAVAARVPRCPV